MRRLIAALIVMLLVAGAPPMATAAGGHGGHGGGGHGGGWRGGGWRGGGHGSFHHHGGSSVFFGFGGFGYPYYYPYAYPYYPYYYYPYPYPYVAYPPYTPLPGDDDTWSTPPPEAPPQQQGRADQPSGEQEPPSTYGLVQLQGVPDGADVDLDGRFWLKADDLDERWLALPQGTHTLSVRAQQAAPIERRIDVAAGKMQVVRFGAASRPRT